MIDSPLFGLFVLGIIAAVLGACFILPRIRGSEEKNISIIYEEISTGWIKKAFGIPVGSNFSPCRLSLYETFFVISTITRTTVPYADVESIAPGKLGALCITFNGGQKSITLMPMNRVKIVDIFLSKGVRIC